MMRRGERQLGFGKFIVSRVLGFALKTCIVMWLWNRLVPEIFCLHTISIFQAFGLMILTRLLTGNPGSHHMMGRSMFMGRGKLMLERWRNMNAEQRKAWMEGGWNNDNPPH